MKKPSSFRSRSSGLPVLCALAAVSACLSIGRALSFAEETGPGRTRPEVRIERTGKALVIDGHLDEPAWQEAAVIPGLTQVDPEEGEEPTMRTEVRLLFDDDFLYLGVRAFDDEPDRIVATEMQRDDRFRADDRIEIVLDTFLDRRNAYLFRVNPLGARSDGLIESGRLVSEDWDGIWYAGASVDEKGWTAEVAIPFKTVAFEPGGTAWGFNIERSVRRDNEISRWASAYRARSIEDVSGAGVITGLHGLKKGVGLDLKPSLTLRRRTGHETFPDKSELVPSLDAFYRVTPSLTFSLTVNTDFAEAEVDEREMELGRFGIFFPEKRDFFLQDAGIFEFGGLNRNGRPFFSRRIGLDEDGNEVGIVSGAKLTGRAGQANIGLLGVRAERAAGPGEETFSVARVNFNVFEQSSVGFIATRGDPAGDDGNSLLGIDAFLRTDRLLDGNVLACRLWLQRSFNNDADDRECAWGGEIEFPNEPFNLSLGFLEIQPGFSPPLGFVNRGGIREYEFNARYRRRLRPSGVIRRVDSTLNIGVVTDTGNNLESVGLRADIFKVENAAGDSAKLTHRFAHERIEEDFRVAHGRIMVPAGNYNDHRVGVELETAESRALSGSIQVARGDFYNGSILELKPALSLRVAPRFRFASEYQVARVDNPAGTVEIRLLKCRAIVQFSPDLSWSTLVQHDNLSRMAGVSTRLRWSIKPGNDLFLVYNRSREKGDADGSPGSSEAEATLKLSWTFRF